MSNKKDKHNSSSSIDDALLDELFRSAATDAAILDGRHQGLLSERKDDSDADSLLVGEQSEINRLRKHLESETQLNDALKVRIDELQAEIDALNEQLEVIKKK